MIKKFYLFAFTILLNSLIFAQNKVIEIDYKMSVVLDPESVMSFYSTPEGFKKETYKAIEKANEEGIFIDYTLLHSDEISMFRMNPKINNNSQSMANLITEYIVNEEKEPLFKDLKNNIYYKRYYTLGADFLIRDSIPRYKWLISKEKDIYLNYNIIKATTILDNGEKITAWYTPDLPIIDGPDKYMGLPGLILKLNNNDDRAKFSYEAINIKDSKQKINNNIKKNKKTYSYKEYKNELEKLRNKTIEYQKTGVDIN